MQEAQAGKAARSIHKPYGEKRCNDCHDFSSKVGLIRPKEQLCIGCHRDFIKGKYVHGPIATGTCSACHLPHMSEFPSLLELPKSEICAKCHKEKRLAETMHNKVMERGMECVDCHDTHYGDARYFLR
jgi:predicted CXXCH cytochrome family protein